MTIASLRLGGGVALTADTPPDHRRGQRRQLRDRRFYAGMSLAAVVTVFLGFARTYYLRSYYQTTPLPLLVQLHGLVFTSWILLFATQTALVAGRRITLHRRRGVALAAAAPWVAFAGALVR